MAGCRCDCCGELVSEEEILRNPRDWDDLNTNNPYLFFSQACKKAALDSEDKYREIEIPDENEDNAYSHQDIIQDLGGLPSVDHFSWGFDDL